MIEFILKLMGKRRRPPLFLVDGDSCIKDTWVYSSITDSSEVVVVHNAAGSNKPKVLNGFPSIQYVPLHDYRGSKETADKLIGIMAQKAIADGYSDIYLVSKDCDFADIARLIATANRDAKSKIHIRVLFPEVRDRAKFVKYENLSEGNVKISIYWIKRVNTSRT